MVDLGGLVVAAWVLAALSVPAAFLAVIVLSFFVRRHNESPWPDPTWSPTEERFRDPSTGRLMRVFVDERTSERHYVPEARR